MFDYKGFIIYLFSGMSNHADRNCDFFVVKNDSSEIIMTVYFFMYKYSDIVRKMLSSFYGDALMV